MPEKKPTRTADLDYFYGQSSELFSFYRIPKLLFQDSRFQPLSTDAKTLYGILLDRMSLSARNGWLDKAGRVFIIYTVQEVQDSLGCADKKATKLLRELEEYGLIERKRRGLGLSCQQIEQNIPALFTDPACGHVLRAKGFVQDENGWVELNATADGLTANAIPKGQEVLIVIGEWLEKERIAVRLKG